MQNNCMKPCAISLICLFVNVKSQPREGVCIVPVPKRQPVREMNDLRAIALTSRSCVMKVLERVMLLQLQNLVATLTPSSLHTGKTGVSMMLCCTS